MQELKKMEKEIPIHETLLVGSLLAMAAGSLDAYTYLLHGEVFAGLQTGNLILFGIHLIHPDNVGVSRYLIAILAFMVGTILIRLFQEKFDHSRRTGIRQSFVIGWEIICMLIVALFASALSDRAASALLSIAAAAQLQEFNRLKGAPFTSLMMTGNIRTLAASILEGLMLKDPKAISKCRDIATIIGSFILGAALVSLLSGILGNQTIFVSIVFLIIALICILTKTKKN